MSFFDFYRDLNFLQEHRRSAFSLVSLEKTAELSQKKDSYKNLFSSVNPLRVDYKQFRKDLNQLSQSKIPFRLTNALKKDINCLSPDALLQIPLLDRLREATTKNSKKIALQEIKKSLVSKAKPLEREMRLAEKILWVHGTNIAILPLLPYSDYSLVPSGVLLNRGIAPMSGEVGLREIGMAGMSKNGVNQRFLSVDSIRGIKRCWEAYASDKSKAFDVNKYVDAKAFFEETMASFNASLAELQKGSSSDASWDFYFAQLLRLKQWNPEAFQALCEDKAKEIEQLKSQAGLQQSKKEYRVLEALDYDIDVLKQAVNNEDVRKKVISHFPECSFDRDLFQGRCLRLLSSWISGEEAFRFLDGGSEQTLVNDTIRIRALGEAEIAWLKANHNTSPAAESVWHQLTEFAGPESRLEFLVDKVIRERIMMRIQKNSLFFENRYNRLLQVFDQKSQVVFNASDRECIKAPFPLLLASTKTKAGLEVDHTEFNIKEAKLGVDIDLIFAHTGDIEKMQAWLMEHHFEKTVQVKSISALPNYNDFPLIHAKSQVIGLLD